MLRKLVIGALVGAGLIVVAAIVFQREIGSRIYERAVDSRVASRMAPAEGLQLALCGTGSPLPNPERAGPCNAVIAGKHVFVIDIGEGGARNLQLMGIDPGRVEALLLTHFHSDHIDGIGPLALLHWTQAHAASPLPVYGPSGVESVTAGFNQAYALDHGYRVAHHGPKIVPPTGGGLVARPFDPPAAPTVIYRADGLTITAFPVHHDPVRPAVGYRFDYRGRSVVISGDTAKTPMIASAARGADILVHDALQPKLVAMMTAALAKNGQAGTAQITRDILTYHASPEQAAESAHDAGVRMLVLSHLVPPIPSRYFYPAFLGDAKDRFGGDIVVGEDGMVFTLPPASTTIEHSKRL